jgi:hypothetical protein
MKASGPSSDRRELSSAGGLLQFQLDIDKAIDYAICKHFTRMRHGAVGEKTRLRTVNWT